MTASLECPACRAPNLPGATTCASCGRKLTSERKSVGGGVTAPMQAFDFPTVVPGATEPRSRESMLQSRMIESLKAATTGEYEIRRELGRGGMAIVFHAHDLSLDREVAIKVMSPALLDGEAAIERFKREAKTAAGLSHPHIIPIHAVRETGDMLYFVMKYVEGRPLDDVIRERGPLPIPMVIQILSEVAGALAYAHKRGVIHRDVKPANIMLDDGGWAMVADFGIAKVAEKQGITMTGMTVGTPAYMSPEQSMTKGVDGRADQYSLGVVAFELLAGRVPFAAESMMEMFLAHLNNPPPPVQSVRHDCPPELAAIVERMLRKMPDERFPNLDEVVAALGALRRIEPKERTRSSMIALARVDETIGEAPTRVLASFPDVAAAPSGAAVPVAPAKPTTVRRRMPLIAAIAVGVVAVASFAWWWVKPSSDPGPEPTPAGTAGPVAAANAPVAKVALTPGRSTIVVGQSAALAIALRDSFDRAVTGRPVRWTSANPAIATVDSGGNVQALAVGSTVVTATVEGQSSSATVDVSDKALVPKSIVVSPRDSTVDVGAKIAPVANVTGDKGASLIGTPVEWKSSAPDVASVDPATGAITALKPGSTTIAAAIRNGPRTSIRLTVIAPRAAVATLAMSASSLSLTVGDTARPLATPMDSRNGPLRDRDVIWSTDRPEILQVDRASGKVTAIKDGEARVVATADTVSRAIAVSVKAAAPAPAPAPVTAAKADSTPAAPATAGAPAFTDISAGGSTTCGALANDGGVLCWGAASTAGALVEGLLFTKISVGDGHICGLTPAGEAYCWGANSQGQLGDGSTTDRDKPVAVKAPQKFADISVGASHTCGLTSDGSAFCWGSNKNGQLGDGSQSNRRQPVLVRSTAGNRGFKAISAGGSHTCGVSQSDKAYCWGDGFSGQVGNAMTDFATEPFAVKTDLSFRTIVAGQRHTCGLTTSGRAYCWGENKFGQLGNETKDDRNVPDSVSTDQIFRAIAAGAQHACGITSARRQMLCWGNNVDGRLGDGTRSSRTVPVMAANGAAFTVLSAGSGHTCALTSSGQAMCWGGNSRAQLGSGSSSPFSAAPVVVKVKGGG